MNGSGGGSGEWWVYIERQATSEGPHRLARMPQGTSRSAGLKGKVKRKEGREKGKKKTRYLASGCSTKEALKRIGGKERWKL